jgi:hypothetical protein
MSGSRTMKLHLFSYSLSSSVDHVFACPMGTTMNLPAEDIYEDFPEHLIDNDAPPLNTELRVKD